MMFDVKGCKHLVDSVASRSFTFAPQVMQSMSRLPKSLHLDPASYDIDFRRERSMDGAEVRDFH